MWVDEGWSDEVWVDEGWSDEIHRPDFGTAKPAIVKQDECVPGPSYRYSGGAKLLQFVGPLRWWYKGR